MYCTLGSRKLLDKLRRDDHIDGIGRDLVRKYMAEIGIRTVYPKPNLSKASKNHMKFPYLLKDMNIWLPNMVWAIDITYISIHRSYMYLTAIIDWFSRFVLNWELSDTLETAPVINCVKTAIKNHGIPAILNRG